MSAKLTFLAPFNEKKLRPIHKLAIVFSYSSPLTNSINSAGLGLMSFSIFTFTAASVPSGFTFLNRLHPQLQAHIGGLLGILSPPMIPSRRYSSRNSISVISQKDSYDWSQYNPSLPYTVSPTSLPVSSYGNSILHEVISYNIF